MRTVKISRRAFLTGLGLASTAALLSACNTVPASSHSGAAPSLPDSEAPSSSAASEVPAQPILSVDEFPITDGSTACIPLIAQIMADTTGLDLETARSAVTLLMELAVGLSDLGVSSATIQSIETGYRYAGEGDRGVLTPMWKLETSGQSYYLNCATGEVTLPTE